MRILPLVACLAVCAFVAPRGFAEAPSPVSLPHSPETWLVLDPVDYRARRPFNPDAVYERHLFDPTSAPPQVDASLEGERGTPAAWKKAQVDEKGRLGGGIAYAYTRVHLATSTLALAHLEGGGTLFVNGTPTPGDIYGGKRGTVAVALREGANDLFVKGVRRSFRLRLDPVTEPLFVADWGHVLPDPVAGEPMDAWIALPVLNASLRARSGIRLRTAGTPVFEPSTSEAGSHLAPLCTLPLSLRLRTRASARLEAGQELTVPIQVVDEAGAPVHQTALTLTVRAPGEPLLRTFRSRIDGSVQSYALRRPSAPAAPRAKQGLVLSLHGAGVEARAQAKAYSARPDFWVAAPTNRGRFGFDWQDWGRLDAYEVLADALAHSGVDRSRVYLTGHSMGGHGTWHLAANDPDGFAAIAPSAGWISFDTYPGKRRLGTRTALWHHADGPSLTLSLLDNLAQLPTFILHGTEDDNVPIGQARQMESYLRRAGNKPTVHYQQGAGHWWNGEAAPGADCVDWPGIFDLFRAHRIPSEPDQIKFTTWNPAVDAQHHWITVEQQRTYGRPATVQAQWAGDTRAVQVYTENVARLAIARSGPYASVTIDGSRVPPSTTGKGVYERAQDGSWFAAPLHREGLAKTPERGGPLRHAWRSHFVLVYGTQTTPDETTALFEQARYDALAWTYRANGRAEVLSDLEYAAREADLQDCNVILYGNADNNRAFRLLDPACPLRVRKGQVVIQGQPHVGTDLGTCFVYPRVGSATHLVGVMGSTGPAGARLGCTLMTFISGAGWPDYVLFSPGILTDGDAGVLDAGFFDRHWKIPPASKPK